MFKSIIRKIKGCEGCKRRRHKLYRWLAKSRLIRRFEYLNEVEKLMEEFSTYIILQGGHSQEFLNAKRQELVKSQNTIQAQNDLIDFLKGL